MLTKAAFILSKNSNISNYDCNLKELFECFI